MGRGWEVVRVCVGLENIDIGVGSIGGEGGGV